MGERKGEWGGGIVMDGGNSTAVREKEEKEDAREGRRGQGTRGAGNVLAYHNLWIAKLLGCCSYRHA